jgi:hypothetical protein
MGAKKKRSDRKDLEPARNQPQRACPEKQSGSGGVPSVARGFNPG